MQENNNTIPSQNPIQVQDQTPSNIPVIEPQLSEATTNSVSTSPTNMTPLVSGPVPTTPETKKTKSPMKMIFIILGVLLLVIVIVAIALFATKGLKGVTDLIPMASSSPTPTPFIEVTPASPYENDLEVLKIKEDLQAFDAKLNGTSVREDTLRIPVLEWNVDFKK